MGEKGGGELNTDTIYSIPTFIQDKNDNIRIISMWYMYKRNYCANSHNVLKLTVLH